MVTVDGGEVVIKGMILLWSGETSSIPAGWALCDGTNGTPDLTDKFVMGAGGDQSPGDTGGEESHMLDISEMPAHTHLVSNYGINVSKYARASSGIPNNVVTDVSLNQGIGPSSSTGGGAAHNNIPPFYALAYIMKT